jgi:hypothetical protein
MYKNPALAELLDTQTSVPSGPLLAPRAIEKISASGLFEGNGHRSNVDAV